MREIKLDIRNEQISKEVLFSGINITVYVDYFWDSHGDLHKFPKGGKYNEEFFAGKVEIIESRYKLYMGDRCINEDGNRWLLYIDGEFIGDVDGYDDSYEDELYVDVVVGAG